MNHTELRDFKPETLLIVSGLIDNRIKEIREIPPFGRTHAQHVELDDLLEFQTQTLYARALVLREQKVTAN